MFHVEKSQLLSLADMKSKELLVQTSKGSVVMSIFDYVTKYLRDEISSPVGVTSRFFVEEVEASEEEVEGYTQWDRFGVPRLSDYSPCVCDAYFWTISSWGKDGRKYNRNCFYLWLDSKEEAEVELLNAWWAYRHEIEDAPPVEFKSEEK